LNRAKLSKHRVCEKSEGCEKKITHVCEIKKAQGLYFEFFSSPNKIHPRPTKLPKIHLHELTHVSVKIT